ncbi:MAG: helix-turn-helix transcriptional regulator [Dissulfurispiraceae bacterium]|jgi:transcriptional regulator with XRE-family HTH domain
MEKRKVNVVGENIRKIRIGSGITQEELALKCDLSQGYINQLEHGKRKYTQKSLELITEALAVPVIELFREEKDERISETTTPYKTRRPDKKVLLSLLNDLPDHIVDHYLTLLKIERDLLEKDKAKKKTGL